MGSHTSAERARQTARSCLRPSASSNGTWEFWIVELADPHTVNGVDLSSAVQLWKARMPPAAARRPDQS